MTVPSFHGIKRFCYPPKSGHSSVRQATCRSHKPRETKRRLGSAGNILSDEDLLMLQERANLRARADGQRSEEPSVDSVGNSDPNGDRTSKSSKEAIGHVKISHFQRKRQQNRFVFLHSRKNNSLSKYLRD